MTKNIRSRSSRCAIETIATRGLPAGVRSMLAMSSGCALEPQREARRGQQAVQAHRQREAILLRIERLEIEHADAA